MRSDATIDVGGHAATAHFLGMTFSLDVIWVTLFAAAVVLALMLTVRRNITSGVPGKLQLFWETLFEQVNELIDSAIGQSGRKYAPLAVTIFLFLLICNWIEVIPSGHNPEWFPAPTSDVNLPLAMALSVIVLVHYSSLRARGFKGYVKHYFQPYPALFLINVIEEITKPITLTLRLFGNLFASVLMVTVITALIPIYAFWPVETVWKLFAMLIGAIQAFIFALLTIIYLSIATNVEEH